MCLVGEMGAGMGVGWRVARLETGMGVIRRRCFFCLCLGLGREGGSWGLWNGLWRLLRGRGRAWWGRRSMRL